MLGWAYLSVPAKFAETVHICVMHMAISTLVCSRVTDSHTDI